MRFRTVAALVALAMGATAQTTISPQVATSVLMVLATAIPQDSVSFALASQSAFAAQVASSLSAGNTPAWYQALPSDVKSLLPALYPVTTPATPTPSASISATPIGANSTTVSAVRTPSLSSPTRSSTPASGNAAPVATAALGAGVGAALGVLGMLAL